MSDTTRPVFSDRYEIQSRIGRGGMADVFLARDLLLDRPVAIKVLFPEFATDPNFVERFRREAQAAANLTHPNVVAVFDWGQEGSTYFIVMEYVDGQTLSDILRREGALPADRAFGLAADVAAALGTAHRNGLVHRDVKPGNILVARSGEVKVADFGISRAMNSATDADLTQAGAVMGTATYFSPEQAQGLQPDPRSDLYSLGIVMYEMVTGEPPFTGENPVAIAYKQVHEMPTAPSRINPSVPNTYERVVRRLLQKDPAKRFQTAEELRAELRRIREGGDPIAAARALPMDVPPSQIRQPANVAPTTALPSVAAGQRAAVAYGQTRALPVTTVHQTGRQPIEYMPAQPPPPDRTGWWVVLGLLGVAAVAVLSFVLWNTLRNDDSGAAAEVSVESVVGKSQGEAESILKTQGLVPKTEFEQSSEEQAGIVLSQNPEGGQVLSRGSTVTLRVGEGLGTEQVPDLTGLLQADAETRLRELGMVPFIQQQADEEVPEGTVISSSPAGETPIGSTVTVFVSSGPGDLEVPDVTGLTEVDALRQLTAADFVVPTSAEEASDNVPEGFVVRTEPAIGTLVEVGSEVKLVISTGPAPARVPDVMGQSEASARQELNDAGFANISVLDAEVDEAANIGVVVAQSPSSNTEVPKSTTITIRVGATLTTTVPPTNPPTTTTTPPATTTTTVVADTTLP